jgi:predicted AAA+ superfamily ATPase
MVLAQLKRFLNKTEKIYDAVRLQRILMDELFPADMLGTDIKNSFRMTVTRLEKETYQLAHLLKEEAEPVELIQTTSILHEPKFFDAAGTDVTLSKTSTGDFEWTDSITHYQEFCRLLMKKTEEWTPPIIGTPFQNYILELILKDDNTFNKKALRYPFSEIGHPVNQQRRYFLEKIRQIFDFDLEEIIERYIDLLQEIEASLGNLDDTYTSKRPTHTRFLPSLKGMNYAIMEKELGIRDAKELKIRLKIALWENPQWEGYLEKIAAYLYSLDIFNLYNVFKVDIWGNLQPIPSYEKYEFENLIGYKRQKELLTNETAAFIAGQDTNNIFIYGPPGTGKSSALNSLLTMFPKLRMILMDKHQVSLLSAIYAKVKDSSHSFIIAFDELSYEVNDEAYKTLQESMEGLVDKLPPNVRIYAAANTKYPVRMDEHEDSGLPDTYAALADRFALKIKFDIPDELTKAEILKYYVQKKDLPLPLPYIMEGFRQWCQENDHHKPNGRNIRDYVRTLRSEPTPSQP